MMPKTQKIRGCGIGDGGMGTMRGEQREGFIFLLKGLGRDSENEQRKGGERKL